MKTIKLLFISLMLISSHSQVISQSSNILVIGANQSMNDDMEGMSKIDILKSSVNEKMGLTDIVIYGEWERDCEKVTWIGSSDTTGNEGASIPSSIDPMGPRSIASGVQSVIDSLQKLERKATIILVTDGTEECKGNLCQIVETGLQRGITFKLNVIAMSLPSESYADFRCATDLSGGYFINAVDKATFSSAIEQARENTIDLPEANFFIDVSKNQKSIDAEITIESRAEDKNNLVLRTFGDTVGAYLAPGKYDLKIRPLIVGIMEGQMANGIEMTADTVMRRSVRFDIGVMKVACQLNGTPWDCMIEVTNAQSNEVVSDSRTFGKAQTIELTPGRYDVRITANRIEGVTSAFMTEGIIVSQGDTTSVEHEFATGKIMIGASSANSLIDANIIIRESGKDKAIVTGRTFSTKSTNPREFLLTPGYYDVTLEALPLSGIDATTVIKNIEVKGGEKTIVDHLYEIGRLSISVANKFGPSEAMIDIMSKDGKTTYTTGRTSTSKDDNKRDFLLTTGAYQVKVQEVGKDASTAKTIDVIVESGATEEVSINF